MTELRPELEPLPDRMKSLSIDRGYPVPWFVPWEPDAEGNLVPEFRAMDRPKFVAAIKHKLCWVCGQRLGSYLAFVIGPMCGITRTTSEPPCHLECAEWSARNCPFLSRPQAVPRDLAADRPDAVQPAGIHIDRNPGVSLVWVTRDYTLFSDGKGGTLIRVGDPVDLTFWSLGKPATRPQIEESVSSGLPILRASEPSPDAEPELIRLLARFMQLLPAAQ
jgi:hypothetical protein